MPTSRTCLAGLVVLALARPAHADEFWAGVYEHGVSLTQTPYEKGPDVKAGWIGDGIAALRAVGRPAPHLLVSKSLNGKTDYVAAGLNWRFGTILYLRPGIGVAVHDGPSRAYRNGRRVDQGSPVLFEPELAFGWWFSEGLALEVSWVHLSHATLFSEQNRGLDSWGLRLLVRLP